MLKNIYRKTISILTAVVLGSGLFSFVGALPASATTSNNVGTWTTEANSLPIEMAAATSVVNGRMYVIGGFLGYGIGGNSNTVFSSQINNDGSVGPWVAEENQLPNYLDFSASVTYNNHIYVLGGQDNSFSGVVDTVYSSTINSDGSIGAWTTEINSLPQALSGGMAFVYSGRVYYMGGANVGSSYGNAVDTVYSAPINNDGSIGAWTTEANSLPDQIEFATTVAYNGHVYVLGGVDINTGLNTVFSAPINNDGSIGAWTTEANSLPDLVDSATSVVFNGRIYTFGGFNGGQNFSSNVYSSSINHDGSIGPWETETNSLPNALGYATGVVYKSHVYIAGGFDGGFYNTVFSAPLNGTLSQTSNSLSGKSSVVSPLSNVIDSQDNTTLSILTQPSHGTASVSSSGITYTSTNGYVGSDSLVYQICASYNHDVCSTITLSLNVTAAVNAPNTGAGNMSNSKLVIISIILISTIVSVGYIFRNKFLIKN